MFLGVMPAPIRNYVGDVLSMVQPKRLLVPCAGNFTIEQVARRILPHCQIDSTDVNLYSCALGFGLTGEASRLTPKPWLREELSSASWSKPIELAAGIALASELIPIRLKGKHRYYRALLHQAITRQEELYSKGLLQIEKLRDTIGTFRFRAMDLVKLLDEVQPGDLVVFDPPSIRGGYEKMFQALEEAFEWPDRPSYTDMNEERVLEECQKVHDRGGKMVLLRFEPLKAVPEAFQLRMLYRFRPDQHYHVYTNFEAPVRVGRNPILREKPRRYPVIGIEDEITENSRVDIVPVEGAIANHYRLMWVKKARMASAAFNYLVAIDGKVAGVLSADSGMTYGRDTVVLFSDPAAPTSRYKRLGKLIIYLASTKEFIQEINERSMWDHCAILTSVTSNHAESMKYRGLFQMKLRKEIPGENFRFRLTYENRDKILDRYRDGLAEWCRKHAQTK